MRLNCKKCGRSQDHFWTRRYNPITVLERMYKAALLRADLDGRILDYASASHVTTWRELIAEESERAAAKVRNMRVRTRAELKGVGLDKVVCPDCGLTGLDMD